MFTCMCTSEKEDYAIEFKRFFSTARSSVWWLVHMHEKVWMQEEWHEFMDMLTRYKEKEEMLQEESMHATSR